MTIEEKLIKQITIIRECMADYEDEAKKYADAKNDFEEAEAKAGCDIINGYFFNDEGEQIILSNDYARRAYLKDRTITFARAMNTAKEMRDASAAKVEVERSVMSVLKELAGDENFDREILGRYDV